MPIHSSLDHSIDALMYAISEYYEEVDSFPFKDVGDLWNEIGDLWDDKKKKRTDFFGES